MALIHVGGSIRTKIGTRTATGITIPMEEKVEGSTIKTRTNVENRSRASIARIARVMITIPVILHAKIPLTKAYSTIETCSRTNKIIPMSIRVRKTIRRKARRIFVKAPDLGLADVIDI